MNMRIALIIEEVSLPIYNHYKLNVEEIPSKYIMLIILFTN